MKRIYQRLTKRQAILFKRAKVAIAEVEIVDQIVAFVGLATFFFGFFAGAVLNLYLIAINNPLVLQFRSALSYKSAIFGDGILLPIVNMVAASFLLKNWDYATKRIVQLAMVCGAAVTAWFHINQAMQGVINWAMPAPWQWNILGLWHGIYMFAVASLLSLFYLVVLGVVKEEREVSKEAFWVTVGIIAFFILLRLDYISINLSAFIPKL